MVSLFSTSIIYYALLPVYVDIVSFTYNRGQYTRGALRNAGPERLSLDNPSKVPIRDRDRHRSSPANLSMDIDLAIRGQSSSSQDSLSNDSDFPGKLPLGSMDFSDQNLDFSMVSSTPSEPLPKNSVSGL